MITSGVVQHTIGARDTSNLITTSSLSKLMFWTRIQWYCRHPRCGGVQPRSPWYVGPTTATNFRNDAIRHFPPEQLSSSLAQISSKNSLAIQRHYNTVFASCIFAMAASTLTGKPPFRYLRGLHVPGAECTVLERSARRAVVK